MVDKPSKRQRNILSFTELYRLAKRNIIDLCQFS